MSSGGDLFIGRQPILDRRQQIAAYELLFRSSADAQVASFPEVDRAAARVAFDAFGSLGTDAIIGSQLGFVNIGPGLLMTDALEALPRDRVVLEILETVEASASVKARCRQLQRRGFTLALDDYISKDPRADLLDVVDYVKVDILQVEARDLRRLVRDLKRRPLKLVAEKVEDREQFEICQKLGFDYFQGFHFARAEVLTGRRLDPARALLLDLLGELAREPSIDQVARRFKEHPSLGVNLLRLVNSAALVSRMQVGTVQHALMVLGERQLRRWLTLLLFAGDNEQGYAAPLLQTASMRARLMEKLTPGILHQGSPEAPERAFLTGMLSLTDTLLGVSMTSVLDRLHVEDEIRTALLERGGSLGRLLSLAEQVERANFKEVQEALDELGIASEELKGAQLDSYRWAQQIEEIGSAEASS